MIIKNLEIYLDLDNPKMSKGNYEAHVIQKYANQGYMVVKNFPNPRGMPDLSVYNKDGILQFMIEVKSPSDCLKLEQFFFIKDNPNIKIVLYKFMSIKYVDSVYYSKTSMSNLEVVKLELPRVLAKTDIF